MDPGEIFKPTVGRIDPVLSKKKKTKNQRSRDKK